jgi:Tfp pilus assembly protein PilX
MAVIRSLVLGSRSASRHPTDVDAEYQAVNGAEEKLFQISTFGSDDRASEPKVSQTIQLNEALAKDLLRAIRSVFPGLS